MKWVEFAALLTWISGIVFAEGGWSTFFAIIFPPWAYYLVVEHTLMLLGWL